MCMKKSNFIFAIKPVSYLSRWLKLSIMDSKIIQVGIAFTVLFFLPSLLGGVGGGFFIGGAGVGFAQGVGINETGAAPNPSALLDISDSGSVNHKGLLIPRLTSAQRDAIPSPAQSLLIYNTTNKCMEIWENAQWNSIWCATCPVPSSVSATATPNPICEVQTLSLNGSATGATSWLWGGPNGFSSSLQNPTITNITILGTGVYTLTATNSCGSATPVNTASVTVNAIPTAVTVSGGGTFCNNATLNASGGTGGTIYWQGTTSGGTSTATPSTSQVVSSSGTYYFRAYNSCGWGIEGSATVTITTLPTAVSVSGGGTFCGSATLTASGGTGGTIYWQGTTSGGTSTSTPSTSQNVSSSGTYYFRAYNSCGWGTEGSATVTISPPVPNTPGAISGPTTVTGGSAGNVYSISSVPNATSYTWSVPCGASITAGQGTTSITVTYASNPSSLLYTTPGTYTANCIKGATIEVIGGGGGGCNNGGGGGGGGGYASGTYTGLSGASLSVTIGDGGVAGWGGTNGGTTSVGSLISSTGGTGGIYSATPTPGIGGSGTGGTTNYTGGNGGSGIYTYIGGGGGGAAGPSGNGGIGGSVSGSGCTGSPSTGGVGGTSGGAPAGAGGKGNGYNTTICTSPNYSVAGSNYGGGGGGGNGSGTIGGSNAAGGYCNITSITYGGNITVTANNSCGSSAESSLSVTINP